MAYIEVIDTYKRYKVGENTVVANNGINFSIEKGEFVVILGPSGAGKSTVLNILGGMDTCDEGKIIIDKTDISKFNNKQLTKYRRHDVGFVFQFYNLVQNLTAKENVELATQISKNSLDVDKTLELVGLEDRKDNFPSQLSGGEQQRVSIARAIAKNPKLLLCDEPTGALDYHTSKDILQLIEDVNKKYGNTIIIVTHNDAIKDMADRVIYLHDGRIRENIKNTHKIPAKDLNW